MNWIRRVGPAGLGLLALVAGQAGAEAAPVAVTFDDLPLQGPEGREVSDIFRINERLVEALETRDISEWIFAAAYERAHGEGDRATKHRLGAAYVEYMVAKAEFFERN